MSGSICYLCISLLNYVVRYLVRSLVISFVLLLFVLPLARYLFMSVRFVI